MFDLVVNSRSVVLLWLMDHVSAILYMINES